MLHNVSDSNDQHHDLCGRATVVPAIGRDRSGVLRHDVPLHNDHRADCRILQSTTSVLLPIERWWRWLVFFITVYGN